MSFGFLSIFVSTTGNMAFRQVSQGSNGKKKGNPGLCLRGRLSSWCVVYNKPQELVNITIISRRYRRLVAYKGEISWGEV
jgi:hypothetical protein